MTRPLLVVMCYVLFLLLVVATTVPAAMTFATTLDSTSNQPEPQPQMQLPTPLQPQTQPDRQSSLEERLLNRSPRHLVLNLTEQITFQEGAETTSSPFELTISSDQRSANIVVGNTSQATLTVGLTSGNAQPVSLSCNLSPASSEASCNISPSVVTPTGTATLTIATEDTISPGQYTATITATPERGINRTTNFVVAVDAKPDINPPVINVPSTPIQVNASGPSGAQVQYQRSATDDVDGPINLTCTPPSGSTFPIGETVVTCEATDSAGNPGEESFTVTVKPPVPPPDTTPPVITVPEDITEETTSPDGIQVPFEVSVQDDVDRTVEISCDHNSGSIFPIGETVVTCEATDSAGNPASENFTVTVAEAVVDENTLPVITGPPTTPIEVETTSNAGEEVSYAVTAFDKEDGSMTPQCDPPSGSIFRIGETVVTCNIVDNAGNAVSKNFSVIVRGPQDGSLLYIIIPLIIAAIVVIVVIFLLLRRRRMRSRTDFDDEGTRVY